MALSISLKRSFSSKNVLNLLLLRGSLNHVCEISYLSLLSDCEKKANKSVVGVILGGVGVGNGGFGSDWRRGFAKGRGGGNDDNASDTAEVELNWPSVKSAATSQMDAAVVALSRELSKLRTGRASDGMLDHIIVQTSGVKMPLSRLAVVSVIDSNTLSVTPYDAAVITQVENAIVSSPLGLNPRVDGERLVASIPPLTKEHIQAMTKLIAKSSEDVKQSIRRARQKACDAIKKASNPPKNKSGISKDSAKKMEKEVDDLTKKFIKSAEDMCKAKEKEILGS